MYAKHHTLELHLRSAFSSTVIACAAVTLMVSSLYVVRMVIQDVPPEDHIAISALISLMLLITWAAMDQWHVHISLAENRCWVRRYRLGKTQQQSVPVSQIHSARVNSTAIESGDASGDAEVRDSGYIVLVTSLGLIPLGELCEDDLRRSEQACQLINQFLERQNQYLAA